MAAHDTTVGSTPLKREALRQALIEGEQSGEDLPLDMEEIRHEAREEAGLL
ncbi:MAG: type II toxin-antitoxin system ParD family antitoxin [Thiohalocapsa sp.]